MRVVFAVLLVVLVAGAAPTTQSPIQAAPIPHGSGQSVSPSFEEWFKNTDGSYSLSFGYFNRNHEQVLDIPVGPNNKIEPGPPDQGQPTHFLTRRQTGLFTVIVPKDFDPKGKVTWTITANGQAVAVPGHIRPEWEIDALKEVTSGNTPPVVKFEPNGKPGQGPGGTTATLNTVAATPTPLHLWVTDDNIRKRDEGSRGAPLGVAWSKYRGPGTVTIAERTPKIAGDGKAETTATFAEPGEYVLRVLAWDSSGGQGLTMAGGFQCCWTNGYVKVSVSSVDKKSR